MRAAGAGVVEFLLLKDPWLLLGIWGLDTACGGPEEATGGDAKWV